MDQITAKLTEIDALHAALARAYRGLAAIAETEGKDYEAIRKHAEKAAGGPRSTESFRRMLAEIRRPKGPIVALAWSGNQRDQREPLPVEVIRRTEQRVLIRWRHGGDGTWYYLKNGCEIGERDAYLGAWRLDETSLAAIRAMPVGENAVSRALKAAKP